MVRTHKLCEKLFPFKLNMLFSASSWKQHERLPHESEIGPLKNYFSRLFLCAYTAYKSHVFSYQNANFLKQNKKAKVSPCVLFLSRCTDFRTVDTTVFIPDGFRVSVAL